MQLQIDDQLFEINEESKPHRKWVRFLWSLNYWSKDPLKDNTSEQMEVQKKIDILRNRLWELDMVKLPPTPENMEPIKLWYAAQVQKSALNEEWEKLIVQRRKLENQYAQKRHNLVKIRSGAQMFKDWVVAELHHQHPTTLISVVDVIRLLETTYEKWMKRD